MAHFEFCLSVLIAAILAFGGDNLMLRGIVDENRNLYDIGKLLYGGGTSEILVLLVVLFTRPIG